MGRTGSQTIHLDLLDLSGNKLDGRACDLLAMVVYKCIPSMARLEVLWLSRNPIGSGGVQVTLWQWSETTVAVQHWDWGARL